MRFTKMQASGNDFIFFGSPLQNLPPDTAFIRKLCDRHYGVGADCAVFIGRDENNDYYMRVYNPDGFEAEMCGNALLCSGVYISEHGHYNKNVFSVMTRSGVRMVAVDGKRAFAEIGSPIVLSKGEIGLGNAHYKYYEINVGNPHCVVLKSNISDEEFFEYGRTLENHPLFKNGTNVEFADIQDGGNITIRTWERGIGETLCCVTGSCASAKAAFEEGIIRDEYTVSQSGGNVRIEAKGCGSYFASGECATVFSGNTEF